MNHEDSYSGVSSTNRGIFMLAILLNVVVLQLFGSAFVGEFSPSRFLYRPSKYYMKGNYDIISRELYEIEHGKRDL